jgi:SAM-dependent methyltransferase
MDHHHHAGTWDWAERSRDLVVEGEVWAPAVEHAIAWLAERTPHAQTVLDVGSGPGVAACAFLERLPTAQLLAVDGAEPLLDLARSRAAQLGVADRLSTRVGELPHDLSSLPPADLVWISDVAHHLPDPVAALRALGALVSDGGLLAVREGGLPLRFLPDGVAPGLLSRVEAAADVLTSEGHHPAGRLAPPAAWPALMAQAGLEPAGSRSFLLDRPARLDDQSRSWLHQRLTRLRSLVEGRVDATDLAALDLLVDPDAPTGVLQHPDVYVLTATTVHTAQAAGR